MIGAGWLAGMWVSEKLDCLVSHKRNGNSVPRTEGHLQSLASIHVTQTVRDIALGDLSWERSSAGLRVTCSRHPHLRRIARYKTSMDRVDPERRCNLVELQIFPVMEMKLGEIDNEKLCHSPDRGDCHCHLQMRRFVFCPRPRYAGHDYRVVWFSIFRRVKSGKSIYALAPLSSRIDCLEAGWCVDASRMSSLKAEKKNSFQLERFVRGTNLIFRFEEA